MLTCPVSGRRLRGRLRVFVVDEYRENTLLGEIDAESAVEGIAGGMYLPVGSMRSVSALILQRRTNDQFPGPLPKMRPTAYQETVGDRDSPIVARVWQHGRNAQQWGLR